MFRLTILILCLVGLAACTSGKSSNTELPVSQKPTGAAMADFTDLTAGDGFFCGLKDSGEVYCWGGRFGNSKVQLTNSTGFKFVSIVGSKFSQTICGISSEGKMYCNGLVDQGCPFCKKTDDFNLVPDRYSKQFGGGIKAGQVALGPNYGCFIGGDTILYCWFDPTIANGVKLCIKDAISGSSSDDAKRNWFAEISNLSNSEAKAEMSNGPIKIPKSIFLVGGPTLGYNPSVSLIDVYSVVGGTNYICYKGSTTGGDSVQCIGIDDTGYSYDSSTLCTGPSAATISPTGPTPSPTPNVSRLFGIPKELMANASSNHLTYPRSAKIYAGQYSLGVMSDAKPDDSGLAVTGSSNFKELWKDNSGGLNSFSINLSNYFKDEAVCKTKESQVAAALRAGNSEGITKVSPNGDCVILGDSVEVVCADDPTKSYISDKSIKRIVTNQYGKYVLINGAIKKLSEKGTDFIPETY